MKTMRIVKSENTTIEGPGKIPHQQGFFPGKQREYGRDRISQGRTVIKFRMFCENTDIVIVDEFKIGT
jgi:hypothetical protein